ncbi:MAG: family 43 glycosylhydrolase [Clostridia bacterium]|nr:family 43 glycosylhydrolase [Clostridia bacterium]
MKRQIAALAMAFLTLLMVACAGSGTGNSTEPPTDTHREAVSSSEEAAGGNTAEESTAAATEPETESETFVMGSFQNPLSTGSAPDPVVVYHEGYYYATFTEALGIALYRCKDLKTVLSVEKLVIFNLCDEVQGNIWAPELHYNPATDR